MASPDSEDGIGTKTKMAKLEANNAAAVTISYYEQIGEQRIEENMEKMQKLDLLDLSLKLKKTPRTFKKPSATHNAQSQPQNQRRSSRRITLLPVSYTYSVPRGSYNLTKKEKKEVEIHIRKGTKPEVYTKENEKLLRQCETDRELYVDGYDKDEECIYDPNNGENCHQCG